MYYVSVMLVVSLSSSVSGDLASLRRFAQGGPPPAGAKQVAGSGLNRFTLSPQLSAGTSDNRPSVEVTSSPTPRQDVGVFFPIPSGSKVIKHVALQQVPTVRSNATPLPTPEHSTLLKALGKSDPGFVATNSRNLEFEMGLVRIPKNQAINPPLAVSNAPRVHHYKSSSLFPGSDVPEWCPPGTPSQLESQPALPGFARIPQLQSSNLGPSTPPPSRVQFQPDEFRADDNTEVFSDPQQLNDDELELEAAVSMIRNNWHFIKSGGRLIISHREDDPIIISRDSIQRL